MVIVFKLGPEDQARRLAAIERSALTYFQPPKYSVNVETHWADLTAYVTVTVEPDPPFAGNSVTHAIVFPRGETVVYSEWPEPIPVPPSDEDSC